MRILLLILLILCCGCANFEARRKPKDKVDAADMARQGIFIAVLTTDVIQSNRMPEYPEQNIFLGEHPSRQKVVNYNIIMAALNTGVAYILPDKYRDVFQYVSIGVELEAINHNRKIR